VTHDLDFFSSYRLPGTEDHSISDKIQEGWKIVGYIVSPFKPKHLYTRVQTVEGEQKLFLNIGSTGTRETYKMYLVPPQYLEEVAGLYNAEERSIDNTNRRVGLCEY
jgi:hypothetical protein